MSRLERLQLLWLEKQKLLCERDWWSRRTGCEEPKKTAGECEEGPAQTRAEGGEVERPTCAAEEEVPEGRAEAWPCVPQRSTG